ncbi:unnamed protein product [Cylicostephanus goldi]|uniref:PH domain-containing protein n=1 Tax=Cylicostephanus goldi TaxID=71465 RepID=A0A3P6QIH5_CYLGO|nr:unnamed protein product [Cylicostephanus goldi]
MFLSSAAQTLSNTLRMPIRVKKGIVMKYKGSVSNKWKIHQVILFSDSKLCWYEKLGNAGSKGFVFLKDVVPYICVGTMTDRMPVKSPILPDGYSKHHLVGIGMDRKAETVHWILFSSIAEIESWVVEIINTLPIVSQLPHRCPLAPLELVPPSSGEFVGIVLWPKSLKEVQIFPANAPPSDCVQQSDYRSGSYSSDCFDGRILDDAAFDKSFGTAMLAGALISHGLGSMWGQSGDSYRSVSRNGSTAFRAATSEVRVSVIEIFLQNIKARIRSLSLLLLTAFLFD